MLNKPKLELGAGRKFQASKPPEPDVVIPTAKPAPAKAKPQLEGKVPVTVQTFTLAGVTHSGYPFDKLELGQDLKLVLDPLGAVVRPGVGHPDPNAVSVQDLNDRHIGYLKSAVAAVVSKALRAEKFSYTANVELLKGGRDGLNWGVDVLVKFYTSKKDS